MRVLAWITDPHFNCVSLQRWEPFVEQIRRVRPDAVMLTGDISEAEDVVWQLQRLQSEIAAPIYFVLGNHDFYGARIATVRESTQSACRADDGLVYLTAEGPAKLSPSWTVCGDDGWADARVGDYWGSPVRMLDFERIADLRGEQHVRLKQLKRLGAESALRLRRQLEVARQSGTPNLLVLTHVPPFRECCWYEGRLTDDTWAPFFVNYSMGWMLRRFCMRFADLQVVVLCGHTHHAGSTTVLPNLKVYTGAADYGQPRIHETFRTTETELLPSSYD